MEEQWIEEIENAVEKIIKDLCSRKGFDIDSLPEDIQQEIKDSWYDIIHDELYGED